jgi:hypothetical protein
MRKPLEVLVLSVIVILLFVRDARADTPCNKASLKTVFGFAGMGSIPLRTKDGTVRYDTVSHVGIATYDGQGGVTVSARVQFEGKTSPFTFVGIYDVSANCAGIATFKDKNGDVELVWQFVVVRGGEEIETMVLRPPTQTRPMYSLTFTQKKR